MAEVPTHYQSEKRKQTEFITAVETLQNVEGTGPSRRQVGASPSTCRIHRDSFGRWRA